MKSCKVSSMHRAALQLYQALEDFSKQYPEIPIIQKALNEANVVKAEVAQSLLESFSTELSAVDSVIVFNMLQDTHLYSESDLRFAFLFGRKQKIQQKIAPLPKSTPFFFFTRLTDIYRDSIVSLCTNYLALFPIYDAEGDLTLNFFLHSEIRHYCSILLETLNKIDIQSDAKEAIRTALYFATALIRFKFNFVPLIDSTFDSSKWGRNKSS